MCNSKIYILNMYIGIEIFEPLVVYANNKRDQAYNNIDNNNSSSSDSSIHDSNSINQGDIHSNTHNTSGSNTHSNSNAHSNSDTHTNYKYNSNSNTHNKYNLHYIAASTNAPNFKQIFANINIYKICIQFPDPWYDKKCNRRIDNSSIIQQISDLLKPNNGELYITTDIYELAIYMRDIVLNSGLFKYHILHYTHGSRYPWGHNSDLSSVDTMSAVLVPVLETSVGSHSKRLKTDHTSTDTTSTNDNTNNNITTPAAATTTTSSTTNSNTTATAHIDIEHQWLRVRPYIIGTERDQVCELKRDAAIYRMLFSSV